MLPRIQQILKVEPYKIIFKWSTEEVRMIDLESKLTEKAKLTITGNVYYKLLDKQLFQKVQLDVDAGTIYWLNLITMTDYDGTSKPAQFDICPDVLYSMSQLC